MYMDRMDRQETMNWLAEALKDYMIKYSDAAISSKYFSSILRRINVDRKSYINYKVTEVTWNCSVCLS